jgi:hypothetical protein
MPSCVTSLGASVTSYPPQTVSHAAQTRQIPEHAVIECRRSCCQYLKQLFGSYFQHSLIL